ncbi:MAG: DUF4184 family protein [Candidatus Micrarchaeota archaeon]
MPFTPFHWAVALFGLIFFNVLYLPALIISSVLMDLEPFYYMFFSPPADGVLHGFFHTYLAVTILALVVAFVLIKFRPAIDKRMARFSASQTRISNNWIIASSLLAAWSHVFLDSFLYTDIKPFWPLTNANPFLGMLSSSTVYLLCMLGLVAAIVLWVIKLVKK